MYTICKYFFYSIHKKLQLITFIYAVMCSFEFPEIQDADSPQFKRFWERGSSFKVVQNHLTNLHVFPTALEFFDRNLIYSQDDSFVSKQGENPRENHAKRTSVRDNLEILNLIPTCKFQHRSGKNGCRPKERPNQRAKRPRTERSWLWFQFAAILFNSRNNSS